MQDQDKHHDQITALFDLVSSGNDSGPRLDTPSALIRIDDVAMPDPTSYEIPFDDLDSSDSSRSESGIQIRNRVRAFITQINLGWRVSGTQAAKILAASRPDRVKVQFFDPGINPESPDYDPTQGLYSTKQMLVQSRTCSLVRFTGEQAPQGNLWDISFTLVEY